MSQTEIYTVLPYLKTTRPVTIRGITFRSNDDIDDLTDEIQTQLKALFSMFFLRDSLRIKRMCYAVVTVDDTDSERAEAVFRQLREARTLIGYLYSSPDRSGGTFLAAEHSSLYLFRPQIVSRFLIHPEHNVENVSADSENVSDDTRIAGYEGSVNFESMLWVIPNSRIYPPKVSFWLNISQDLFYDMEITLHRSSTWALEELFYRRDHSELLDRVFTAIEWYNRSSALDTREDVALINLAIAFESLFQLEQGEHLADRFKETIFTLLGPVPRLDSWIDQFYAARSKIVHTGRTGYLGFYAVDKKLLVDIRKGKREETPYQTLSSYGRQIFRICLNLILSSAQLVQASNLSSTFIHNQERLERICELLSANGEDHEKIIRSAAKEILELKEYWTISERHVKPSTAFAAGKLALKHFAKTNPPIPNEVANHVEEILQLPSNTKTYDLFTAFKNLSESVRRWKGNDIYYDHQVIQSAELTDIIRLLVEFIALPGFPFDFLWEK